MEGFANKEQRPLSMLRLTVLKFKIGTGSFWLHSSYIESNPHSDADADVYRQLNTNKH